MNYRNRLNKYTSHVRIIVITIIIITLGWGYGPRGDCWGLRNVPYLGS